MTEPDIFDLISTIEPFSTSPEETRHSLAQRFVEREVSAGTELIRRGETSSTLFVVVEGTFSIFVGGEAIATVGKRGVFGEIGAVSGIPATATVRADSSAVVVSIGAKDLHAVLYHSPQLAEALLRSLAQYL